MQRPSSPPLRQKQTGGAECPKQTGGAERPKHTGGAERRVATATR
ncbi:MAG: hypothetical protein ACAH83_16360 [Alphaproteobacteria bacterium]